MRYGQLKGQLPAQGFWHGAQGACATVFPCLRGKPFLHHHLIGETMAKAAKTGDKKAGDTAGDGMGGVWHVMAQ